MELKFNNEAYESFLKQKTVIHNERVRPDDMSFWDWLSLPENDMRNNEEGRRILEIIRQLGEDEEKQWPANKPKFVSFTELFPQQESEIPETEEYRRLIEIFSHLGEDE